MLDKFLEHIQGKHNSKNNMRLLKYSLQKVENCTGKYLDNLTYEDIAKFFNSLDMEDSSIETIQRKLVQYYTWLFDSTDDPRFHKLAVQIKKGKIARPKTKISAADLISPDEAKKLINVATIERDRAIIATLWESGMRIGELLALTNNMVHMDEVKQEVTFNIPDIEGCKTGSRSVPCLEIYGYIQDWMKCNTSNKFMPITDVGIRKIVKNLYNRAGINKKCNPHMLRHSQITYMASIGATETALSYRFWGIPHSAMVTVYIHLSEQQKADNYRNVKGMGEANGTTIVNPLALRCVECGRLIQSGNLCKSCEDTKKIKEENISLKSRQEALEERNTKLEDELGLLKFMVNKYMKEQKK